MDVPAEIAAFACSLRVEQLPESAVAVIQASVLDGLGCMLLGCGDPAVEALTVSGVARTGPSGCAIIGRELRASPPDAAQLNGTACHSQSYDDYCHATRSHPSSTILPAALAACEERGGSGADLIAAYAAGFETEVLVGLLAGARQDRGAPCMATTLATLGAAASAARAYELDAERTLTALDLAAALAPGPAAIPAPMVEVLLTGWAARTGLAAARLAMAGATSSSKEVPEAPTGFSTFLGRPAGGLPAGAHPGDPLWIDREGIALMAYPCSAALRTFVEAALEVRSAKDFSDRDVVEIACRAAPLVPMTVAQPNPGSPQEAKTSVPFCLAAALVDGRVRLDTFHSKALKKPAIRRLLPLVRLETDPGIPGSCRQTDSGAASDEAGREPFPATVSVRMKDGSRIERTVLVPRGDPARPLSMEERHAKFREMALPSYPPEIVSEIIARVEDLRSERSLVALLGLVGA